MCKLTGKESTLLMDASLIDLFDCLPDPTFIINHEKKVVIWNSSIEKMSGVTRDQMIGKSDYLYAVPFYGEPKPMLIDAALDGCAEVSGDYHEVEWRDNILFAEAHLPKMFGGMGAHIRAAAASITDRDGNIVGAVEELQDISRQKQLDLTLFQTEKDLRVLVRALGTVKTFKNMGVKDRQDDELCLAKYIHANFSELISPYLERLKKCRMDQSQKCYVNIIESSIKNILSPFIAHLTQGFVSLTPMEIQVADLIRNGKSNKEIAEILHIATRTVETHRYNLRTKLGITNDKINLRSYLLTIE